MKSTPTPASSDSEASSSDGSSSYGSIDRVKEKTSKEVASKVPQAKRRRGDSNASSSASSNSAASSSVNDAELEDSFHKNNSNDDDNKWSDEEASDSDDSEDDGKNKNDERNQELSLMQRLQEQESRQESMRTTTALKIKRERRIKAIPIAKERLEAFKSSKSKKYNKNSDDEIDDTDDDESDDDKEEQDATTNKKRKKKSKHAPTEVSSRRSRKHFRTLNESGIGVEIGSNRYQPRDPRMSNLSGHFSQENFEHHYGFLSEVQSGEIGTIKLKLRALQMSGKKGQRRRQKLGMTANDTASTLQDQLLQLQTTVARQDQQRLERKAKRAVKQKLQSQVIAQGKSGVYYPKRHELKKMTLEARMEEIQKSKGKKGLDKYLAKRRKKLKSQQAKKMKRTIGED